MTRDGIAYGESGNKCGIILQLVSHTIASVGKQVGLFRERNVDAIVRAISELARQVNIQFVGCNGVMQRTGWDMSKKDKIFIIRHIYRVYREDGFNHGSRNIVAVMCGHHFHAVNDPIGRDGVARAVRQIH